MSVSPPPPRSFVERETHLCSRLAMRSRLDSPVARPVCEFGSRRRLPLTSTRSDDDIAVLCEIVVMPIVDNVSQFITSDDPRTLCGLAVVAIFKHITNLFRQFTVQISGPLPRRHRLRESAVHALWGGIEQSVTYSAQFRTAIESTQWGDTPPKSYVLPSPLPH